MTRTSPGRTPCATCTLLDTAFSTAAVHLRLILKVNADV